MSVECRCDVVVIGGSLVGSAAALFLAQQGLSVALVERRATVSPHPRARGISVRTMELYRAAGIEPAIRDAGEDDFRFVLAGTLAADHTVGPRDTDLLARLSPTTPCSCDQNKVEPILRRRAEEFGARIWTGCDAALGHQGRSEVTVHLSPSVDSDHRRDPLPARITARYVVAADGANSALRHRLRVGQHGNAIPGTGLSALFDADLTHALRGRRISALISPPHGAVLFLQGKSRAHHWFGLTPRLELDGLAPDGLDPVAEYSIRSTVGDPNLAIHLRSVLSWTTGAYVTNQFRSRRMFFVGDAAHLMPPYGGFGGNTGIADAHNLAWKLAAVCNGDAHEALLDTYDSERRPVADYTVHHVTTRGLAGEPFNPEPSSPRLSPAHISVGICYPTAWMAPTTWPVRDPIDSFGVPGMRVPHVALYGAQPSTLDLVDPTGFTFLTSDDGPLAAALRAQPVRAVRLQTVKRSRAVDAAAFDRVFANHSDGLLIRPDGHVGWRASGPIADAPRAVAWAHRHCVDAA